MAKKKSTANPVGRPPIYNRKEILDRIKVEMAKGDRCLHDICQDEGMPTRESIYLWIAEETEQGRELLNIFREAQDLWCWAQKDIIIKIADDESRDVIEDVIHKENEDGSITEFVKRKSDNTACQRDKLRITTRQWAMTKLGSRNFGDKITQEHTGAEGKDLIPILNIHIQK